MIDTGTVPVAQCEATRIWIITLCVIIQIRNMEFSVLVDQDQETQTRPPCYGIRTLVKVTIGTL